MCAVLLRIRVGCSSQVHSGGLGRRGCGRCGREVICAQVAPRRRGAHANDCENRRHFGPSFLDVKALAANTTDERMASGIAGDRIRIRPMQLVVPSDRAVRIFSRWAPRRPTCFRRSPPQVFNHFYRRDLKPCTRSYTRDSPLYTSKFEPLSALLLSTLRPHTANCGCARLCGRGGGAWGEGERGPLL